ncbi:MAG: hypothetical protein Q8N53_20840 [Longimicrobiales bacterium]|nr:hypothetical protein [Longimicrobiales bacterium]
MKSAVSGLLVIVVGVLLALAGDAAWAERMDRIREQQILADLLDEFQENDARLRADIETNRQAAAAGAAWAEVMLGQDTVSGDSLAALYLASNNTARFDPVTGALRSLLDASELDIIQDDELRQVLAGWSDRAEEVRNTAREMNTTRAGLIAVVLSVNPGRHLGEGARTAVLMDADYAGGGGLEQQMEALLEHLSGIIVRIEQALGS